MDIFIADFKGRAEYFIENLVFCKTARSKPNFSYHVCFWNYINFSKLSTSTNLKKERKGGIREHLVCKFALCADIVRENHILQKGLNRYLISVKRKPIHSSYIQFLLCYLQIKLFHTHWKYTEKDWNFQNYSKEQNCTRNAILRSTFMVYALWATSRCKFTIINCPIKIVENIPEKYDTMTWLVNFIT